LVEVVGEVKVGKGGGDCETYLREIGKFLKKLQSMRGGGGGKKFFILFIFLLPHPTF